MTFRDEIARADAEQAAVDPQFESRIAREMEQEGIEYHGRLVLAAPFRSNLATKKPCVASASPARTHLTPCGVFCSPRVGHSGKHLAKLHPSLPHSLSTAATTSSFSSL